MQRRPSREASPAGSRQAEATQMRQRGMAPWQAGRRLRAEQAGRQASRPETHLPRQAGTQRQAGSGAGEQ